MNDDSRLSPQQREAIKRTLARMDREDAERGKRAREMADRSGLTGEARDEEAARLYVEMVKGGGVESGREPEAR